MATTTAPRTAPPSRPAPPAPPRPTTTPTTTGKSFSFGKAPTTAGERVLIYGLSGIGKTSLAALAPNPVFIDLDESVGKLGLDVQVVNGIDTWADLRAALQAPIWDDVQTIVIDTGTKAEDLAIKHTLQTVRTERGQAAENIEAYGYGKGYQFVYDTFLQLLSDLDQHARAGRNVVIVCHSCTAKEPNAQGEDYQCYQPRLMAPGQEKKNSIRHRLVEWMDHVLFVAYDIYTKDGKASGSGSRTIYPQAAGFALAKSRRLREPVECIEGDGTIWELLNSQE
jgi:hypothetical protein